MRIAICQIESHPALYVGNFAYQEKPFVPKPTDASLSRLGTKLLPLSRNGKLTLLPKLVASPYERKDRRQQPARPPAARPARPRALDPVERQAVLDALRSERFLDQAPAPTMTTIDGGATLISSSLVSMSLTAGRLLNGLDFGRKACDLSEQVQPEPDSVSNVRLRSSKVEKRLVEELIPIARYVQARYREGRRIRARWFATDQPYEASLPDVWPFVFGVIDACCASTAIEATDSDQSGPARGM